MYVNPQIASLNRMKSDEGRGRYLRLDMNENPEGLPEPFFRQVMECITPPLLAMYPETDELIELLARHLQVEKTMVTVANGSDEALKTIFSVFGQQGKTLVAVNPSFAMYPIYAQMAGMQYCEVPYGEDLDIPLQSILGRIDENAGIVSLVNPNNPIGNVYSLEQVKAIIEKTQRVGGLVLIDEAYHYFYSESFVSLVNHYDNLIVSRTFSKLCSIAGLRIGYAVSTPEIVSLLNAGRPTYCVNTVAIEFAKAILKSPEIIPYLQQTERAGREWIKQKLQEQGYSMICKEGNFLFIKTRIPPCDLAQQLNRHGVLVKTYNHPLLKDYIRISTGSVACMERFWGVFIQLEEG